MGIAFRRLGDMMTAAHVAGMVALGLRLGLFKALADGGGGSLTSTELAQRTGLSERWVREWLYTQAAAEVLEHDAGTGEGERFAITPETAALLTDEASLLYVGNNFTALPQRLALVPQLEESFRTGLGLSYDDRGPDAAADTESIFANWYRHMLVPVALPALGDHVVDRLRRGAKVADVGCGSGLALLVLASEFPASEFHGYEASRHALERADRHREDAGVRNVRFHHVDDEKLPADGSFDLVTTFDCLHDMTDPYSTAAAIRSAIAPDGVWLIADIACAPTFGEFVERRRSFAAMAYSMSVFACMSSSLSEPGGAGLGTCGLPEPKMRQLVTDAGFTRFRTLPLEHPVNAFYEARP